MEENSVCCVVKTEDISLHIYERVKELFFQNLFI